MCRLFASHLSRILILTVLTLLVMMPAAARTLNPPQRLAPDDLAANDSFGWAVVIDGDTALIAAHNHRLNIGGTLKQVGAVYVYQWNATTLLWEYSAKLTASDAQGIDEDFGTALALQGDTAIIGAIDDNTNGTGSGAVYVFQRSGTTWTQTQKLLPSDGAPNTQFGTALALDGDRLLIGQPNVVNLPNLPPVGAAYVFERGESGVWTQVSKISGPAQAYGFGAALRLYGDSAFIGAPGDGPFLNYTGAVHVYQRNEVGTWAHQQRLSGCAPFTCALFDLFGASIARYGQDVLLIGAPGVRQNTVSKAGAVYIFLKDDGGQWFAANLLPAPEAVTNGGFGASLVVDGTRLLVGAPRDDGSESSTQPGSAYLYDHRQGELWDLRDVFTSGLNYGDFFGLSVALSGDRILVGAYGDAGSQGNQPLMGAAYAFYLAAEANKPPVITVPGAQTLARVETLTFNTDNNNRIRVNDPDVGAGALFVNLSVSHGTLSLASAAGLTFEMGSPFNAPVMAFSGTQAAINTAFNGLRYTPPVGEDESYPLSVTLMLSVNDLGNTGAGGPLTDIKSVAITVMDAIDLVENGGFEVTGGRFPLTWNVVQAAQGTRARCNTETRPFAHSGNCALILRGNASKNSVLTQRPQASIQAGDRLRIDAFIHGQNIPGGAAVNVVLQYRDGRKQSIKLRLPVGSSGGYRPYSITREVKETPRAVIIKIIYNGRVGTYRIDDLRVWWLPAPSSAPLSHTPAATEADGWLPLPPAP